MLIARTSTRVERAYHDIKNRIMSGEYPPGAPLSESALTRVIEASRTPIREALCRLVEEGYVERVQGRGFHVSRITIQVLQDAFEVRRLLEGTAARRAAELANPTVVARLRRLAPLQAPGWQAEHSNTKFHLAIAEVSRNALLVDLVQHCLVKIERVMAHGVQVPDLMALATREHLAIVDAIAAGDGNRASAAMEHHLDGCSEQLMQLLVRGGLRNIAI